MKRVIIAPDSFKGTLSAVEVCKIISSVLKNKYDDVNTVEIPVADGGEGTVDSLLYALGGEKVYCNVKSPLGNEIRACYGILPDKTGVIEMAEASGIGIEKINNPLRASTFGTGELMLHAINNGIRRLIIGIGGSATTDGGKGMLEALGVRFLDSNSRSVAPGGEGLSELCEIDLSGLDKRLTECDITVLCDVRNPLYGKNGAAYVYARQKGADEKDIEELDRGLRRLAEVTADTLKKDFSGFEGAGAAGGLGFGIMAFLNAKTAPGADTVLEASSFSEKAEEAELVITGEGRLDMQSLMGKVPFSVSEKTRGKRVVAIVGVSEIENGIAEKYGISEIIETNPEHLGFDKIKGRAREMLAAAAEKITL